MTWQHLGRGGGDNCKRRPKGGGGKVVISNAARDDDGDDGDSSWEFELEDALFATAPVGVHCVDSYGMVLWANRFAEMHFLGVDGRVLAAASVTAIAANNEAPPPPPPSSSSSYVGRRVSSFVYSDRVGSNGVRFGGEGADAIDDEAGASSSSSSTSSSRQEQQQQVQNAAADDRTLYEEVLRRATSGNPVCEIPIRFVSRSTGAIVHLLLDCDGIGITRRRGGGCASSSTSISTSSSSRYYRFFTRDDTSRRIQEMRSNVLFLETNRSLQMLDDFMNRSMQMMRMPLTLMERACNLVSENIDDIDEVVGRDAASAYAAMLSSGGGVGVGTNADNDNGNGTRRDGGREEEEEEMNGDDGGRGERDHARTSNPDAGTATTSVAHLLNFVSSLTAALSATSEARSVVGLATSITKDALALVDDITDLCRFDQGRVLLVEKEAVKMRDICNEALEDVSGGMMASMVDVVLDVREGSPGRVVTDRGVLRRSLSLLLNFAIDAATNAVAQTTGSTEGADGGTGRGMVVLSIQEGEASGTCKVSVSHTNPSEAAAAGFATAAGGGGSGGISAPLDFSSITTFASSSSSSGNGGNKEQQHHYPIEGNKNMFDLGGNYDGIGANSSSTTGSFGDGIAPMSKNVGELLQKYHFSVRGEGASVMRRIRLRESIQRDMTSCRRDKLGLGLSLLYHLVGAQGSDLRYEIVKEQQRHHVVSMTKFWFLLPMSLDFPDRLPAEQVVVRDGLHGVNPQGGQPLSLPLPVMSPILLAPSMLPDNGLGKQQPRQKRAKLSHSPVPIDSLNSITGEMAIAPAFAESQSFPSVFASAASSESAQLNSNTQIGVATVDMDITTTHQYPGVASGARPLVLVVEDTDVSASLLCMHLRKLGCTSHRAENGEVAIEMLRSAPTPNMYSLVLMDLRMPVMDGFEATTIIKGISGGNIPVVALTGESSDEIKQRCDEIGFNDYKTKPLKRPQLEELLHKFVPGYNT